MNKSNEELYLELKEKMFEALESDDFYNIFNNSIRSGKNNFSLYQRYMNSVIDIKWIEKIEDSLLALDNIIRNPQRFIKETEEVIPVEQAKRVSEHSIRHLAQNTNLIAKIDDKGFITPSKILNIQKDETFETYENRFIYTLIVHLQYFIDKRLKALHDARVKSEYKIEMENEFTLGNETISYQLSMTSTEKTEKKSKDFDIDADTSQMDAIHRVERLIQIMYDFQNSQFIKSLKGVTLVKPPIMRTNVILKNPNFKKALELWQYIETYYDAGLSIELVENEVVPSEEYINDLFTSTLINYCLFNHHIKPAKKLASKSPQLKKFKPNFVQHIVKEYLEDLQIDVDIVEKVFVDKIKRATAKRKELDKAIAKAIEQAIAKETKNAEKQKLQGERRIKQALKEAKKRRKQEADRLKKLEDDRIKEIAELEAKQEEKIVEQQVEEMETVEPVQAVVEQEIAPIIEMNEAISVVEEEIAQVEEVINESNDVVEEEISEEEVKDTSETISENNEVQEIESNIEVVDIKEEATEDVEEQKVEENKLDKLEEVKESNTKESGFFNKVMSIFRKDKNKELKEMAKRLEAERLEHLRQEELKAEEEVAEEPVEESVSEELVQEEAEAKAIVETKLEEVTEEPVQKSVVSNSAKKKAIPKKKTSTTTKKKTSSKSKKRASSKVKKSTKAKGRRNY